MVSERQRKVRELESPYMLQHEQATQALKRRKKGLRRRLVFLCIVSFTLAAFAAMTIHAQGKVLQEKQEKRDRLELELSQLEKEHSNLQQEIEQYNNLDYIAEIARRDYYLSKPGETIFKLPQSSTD